MRGRVGVSPGQHGNIHNIGLKIARVGLPSGLNRTFANSPGLSEPHRCLMNKLSDGMQSTKNNDKNRRMNY